MRSGDHTGTANTRPYLRARAAVTPPALRRLPRRTVLWGLLLALLLVAQSLLVALTVSYESSRSQDDIDAIGAEVALQMRRDLLQAVQQLQALSWSAADSADWAVATQALMRQRIELLRVERRDSQLQVAAHADSPGQRPLFSQMPRRDLSVDAELTCLAARRQAAPLFSRSYFVPQADGKGMEVLDLCVPVLSAGREDGFVVGTFSLPTLLDGLLTPTTGAAHRGVHRRRRRRAAGTRGRAARGRCLRVRTPGRPARQRAAAARGQRVGPAQPDPQPDAGAGAGPVDRAVRGGAALARDVRRRAQAERALAEALQLRKAMEDSLITGLRARNLDGEVTYANPAFCAMVGFSADELHAPVPPYWPPEFIEQYQQRQDTRRAAALAEQQREGFETVFMRKNGERFPVMIYEAPLRDAQGRHTGWMSTVLDVSAQRRVEELSRQQQDRLQASARLATVGEMASLMSHELNQPLAAIASYASGSLNLLDTPDEQTTPMLRQALERIAEQAERAGRIIKSVHGFVRRRESAREAIGADQLVDGVLPLVRLQARKSGTRVELDMPRRAPRVVCDRTMLEQVLINLTRNGIQAMEEDSTALEDRVLTLRVRQHAPAVGELQRHRPRPGHRARGGGSGCSRRSTPPAPKAWAWA
jgi:two-component system sensor histidine kinase DctS